ncbi:MAG TPA: ferritin-like domain-containing protein [Usitatibacteraceae bacterium]|nr:ferritin-like domain-containing protein [Usitatibacteraceae bacterium]
MDSLRSLALAHLAIADATHKCERVRATAWAAMPIDAGTTLAEPPGLPGRPARPALVLPAQLPKRTLGSREGRGALIHALAHIELNAVNLALDIVWRFPALPDDFYRDWIGVALEEASHFQLLQGHLRQLGFAYGDFDAHDGLWEMAARTADDVLARLALVARVAEARGLDVSPELRDRFAAAGDTAAATILQTILDDEIGHVGIGSRWFHRLCETRGLDPREVHRTFARARGAPPRRGPFNFEARRKAGFSEDEIADLIAEDAQARVRPKN